MTASGTAMQMSLIAAVDRNDQEMLASLIAQKADVNTFGQHGYLLHDAVYKNNVEIVEQLLNAKADPNLKIPSDKRTALHCAVIKQSPRSVRLLLDHKADITPKDWSNNNVYDYYRAGLDNVYWPNRRKRKEEISRLPGMRTLQEIRTLLDEHRATDLLEKRAAMRKILIEAELLKSIPIVLFDLILEFSLEPLLPNEPLLLKVPKEKMSENLRESLSCKKRKSDDSRDNSNDDNPKDSKKMRI